MATASTDIDLLSYCSSLAEILQFVPIKDYLNCQLVNKRMSKVVNSNRRLINPTANSLTIAHIESFGDRYAQISIHTARRGHDVFVTKNTVLLLKCSRGKECNYFDKIGYHGIELSAKEISGDEYETMERFKRFMDKKERYRLYRTNSFEEGFKQLFHPLTSCFNWRQLKLPNNTPHSWITEIVNAFQQTGARCYRMEAHVMKELESVVKALGCSEVTLLSTHGRGWQAEYYSVIKEWKTNSKVVVECEDTQIKWFLKMWQTGSISLTNISIDVTRSNGIPGLSSISVADNLPVFLDEKYVLEESPIEDYKNRNITIKRPSDDKTLQLTAMIGHYSSEVKIIEQ